MEKIKEGSRIITKVKKGGVPASTNGVLVYIYPDTNLCEVEIWDSNGVAVDVVLYNIDEIRPLNE